MKILPTFLVFCIQAFAAFDPNTLIPELKLKNGEILKNVSIIALKSSVLLAKYEGGRGTISYDLLPSNFKASIASLIPPPPRPETKEEKEKREGAAKLRKLKDELKRTQKERENQLEEAITRRAVMVGMTPDQVIRSWGHPDKINSSGGSTGSFDQWIYANGQYLYFRDGLLSSWQN